MCQAIASKEIKYELCSLGKISDICVSWAVCWYLMRLKTSCPPDSLHMYKVFLMIFVILFYHKWIASFWLKSSEINPKNFKIVIGDFWQEYHLELILPSQDKGFSTEKKEATLLFKMLVGLLNEFLVHGQSTWALAFADVFCSVKLIQNESQGGLMMYLEFITIM